VTTSFVQVPAFVLERLVSRRGLMLLFFFSAAWLAVAGWIRPPLSGDISGAQLPLGAWAGGWDVTESLSGPFPPAHLAVKVSGELGADEILHGPRRIWADSVGVLLLAIIVTGAILALCWPRCFATVTGLLLSAAICANAAAVLNHPRLIYLLDLEAEQRAQISRLYSISYDGSMTSVLNDRTRGKPSQLSSAGFLTAVSQSETVPGVTGVVPFFPAIEEERGGLGARAAVRLARASPGRPVTPRSDYWMSRGTRQASFIWRFLCRAGNRLHRSDLFPKASCRMALAAGKDARSRL